jgi:transcriptional regulator with XRE-family HTH domain
MIVNNIKLYCRINGTNIKELEQTLGLSRGLISTWRRCSPRVHNLKKVADHFGITVDRLLVGSFEEAYK